MTVEDLEAEEEMIAILCSDAREELALGDYSRATQAARELLPGASENDPSLKLLCRELAERRVAYFEVAEARLLGNTERERQVLARWATAPEIDHQPSAKGHHDRKLSELLAAFQRDRERTAPVEPKTAFEYDTAIGLFIELFGDLTMAQLDDREPMISFRQSLERLPSNRTKHAAYRGRSASELLDAEIPEPDRMRQNTVKKYVTRLSSLLNWGVQEGWLPRNRAKGVAPRKQKGAVRAFDNEELSRLFAPEHYRRNKEPYKFWLPLLGLFTGCREGELVQLTVDDIEEIDGVWVVRLTEDEARDKRLKGRKGSGKASERKVPMHAGLREVGFLDFVEARARLEPMGRIFPEIAGIDRDRRNATFSKWFNRFRHSCGVGSPEVNFHSFRRNVATQLNGCGHPSLFVDEVMGHERKGLAQSVYHFGSPMVKLRDVVDTLEFPLDLEALRPLAPGVRLQGAARRGIAARSE